MPQPDHEPSPESVVPTSEPTPAPAVAPAARPSAEPADRPVETADDPVPSQSELAQISTPGRVRRAPKFSAFMVAGGLAGAVLGLLVSLLSPVQDAEKPDGSGFLPFLDGANAARTWLVAAGVVLGVLVGGLLAVLADRRSVRGR